MMPLINYMYHSVIIQTKDGRTIAGVVNSYENAVENDNQSDMISIDYGRWNECVFEDEIESIEITGELDND